MKEIQKNNYINDILSQPAVLQKAVQKYPAAEIGRVKSLIANGEIQSIVMAGLGASYSSMYPAYLILTSLDLPVTLLNTADLLHYGSGLLTQDACLWITSQSGESAEVVRLLEETISNRPRFVFGLTDHRESVLGREADVCVDICVGQEYSVATKTFLNSIAYGLLIASQLKQENIGDQIEALLKESHLMKGYLDHWQEEVLRIRSLIQGYEKIFIVGRGFSMASVWDGALLQKEAARVGVEGIHAAEFRHGPLEMVDDTVIVLVLGGPERTAHLNRRLALDILEQGGKAIWVAAEREESLPTLVVPKAPDSVRPMVEILPLQLLSVALASLKGRTPGEFVHINKTVRKE